MQCQDLQGRKKRKGERRTKANIIDLRFVFARWNIRAILRTFDLTLASADCARHEMHDVEEDLVRMTGYQHQGKT